MSQSLEFIVLHHCQYLFPLFILQSNIESDLVILVHAQLQQICQFGWECAEIYMQTLLILQGNKLSFIEVHDLQELVISLISQFDMQ